MDAPDHTASDETAAGPRGGWRFVALRLLHATLNVLSGAGRDPDSLPSRTALVWSLGFVALVFLFYGAGGQDDTYITYWPARVLAEHGRILNYNGVRLEQSSSLSLVVVLAVLYKILPFSLPTVGFLTSMGFGVLTILLAERVARRLRIEPSGAVVPVIATVACFGCWTTSGMETSLVTASGLLMILQLDSLGSARTWAARWVAPPFAVLFFAASRPEAPVLVGGIVLAAVASLLSARTAAQHDLGSRLRLSLRMVLVAAIAVAALLAFRRVYFHAWLPNAARMKTPGFSAIGGLSYLWDCFGLNGFSLAVLALVGLFALAVRMLRRRPGALYCMVGAELLGHLGFVIVSGGDWMKGCRFLAPAIPSLVILGLAAATPWLRDRRQGWALSLLLALSNLLSSAQYVHAGASYGRPGFLLPAAIAWFDLRVGRRGLAPIELANKVHERDAATIGRFLPIVDRAIAVLHRPVWVITGQAGMMAYTLMSSHFGEAKLIDLWSLTTRELYDCLPPGSAPGSRWGTFIGLEQYLTAAKSLEETCGLPQADILYNECLAPDSRQILARHGYRVIYNQLGEVRDLENNRALPGEIAACGYVAVRTELADALGLRFETDWTWNANPR